MSCRLVAKSYGSAHYPPSFARQAMLRSPCHIPGVGAAEDVRLFSVGGVKETLGLIIAEFAKETRN